MRKHTLKWYTPEEKLPTYEKSILFVGKSHGLCYGFRETDAVKNIESWWGCDQEGWSITIKNNDEILEWSYI